MTEPAYEADGFRSRLPALTSLRTFAALYVFAYHVQLQWAAQPARHVFADGYTGVSFFFVLSGVVLAWSQPTSVEARRFWWRRFARIWPATAVTVVLAMLLPDLGGTVRSFALNLALLQPWSTRLDVVFAPSPVTWSLGCEAVFYLAFPILLPLIRRLSPRNRWALVLPWAGATAVLALVGAYHPTLAGWSGFGLATFVNPILRSGEFVLGIAIAVELQAGRRLPFSLRHALGLLVVAVVILRVGHARANAASFLLDPVFALMLAAAATGDLRGAGGLLRHRWLVYAGEVSFCFYLVHQLALYPILGQPGNPSTAAPAQGLLLVLLCLALSVAAAVLLHHLVERPAQRWLSRQSRYFQTLRELPSAR